MNLIKTKIRLILTIFILVATQFFCLLPSDSTQASVLTFLYRKKIKRLAKVSVAEVNKVDRGVRAVKNDPILIRPAHDKTILYMDQIQLRLRPFVALSIPRVLEFRISPWVELFWTRKPPAKWQRYRPQA